MKSLRSALSKNLKRELDERNMTQTDLAHYIGTQPQTVSQWLSGKTYPRDTQIEAIAKALSIPATKLILETDPINIPVLGSVKAGYPALAQQEILDYEEITPEMASMGTIFGLRIHGDSMEPKMSEGDTVLVLEQPDVESGDIAVVMVGQEDATIKRVVKSPEGMTLIAFNPAYTPMHFSAQQCMSLPVRIIGKAIELRVKL